MFVARTTLRRSAGRSARSCSSAGRLPCSGRTSSPRRPASGSSASAASPDLLDPRQEHEDVAPIASDPSSISRDRRRRPRSGSGVVSPVAAYETISTGIRPPFDPDDRAAAEERRDRLGVERGRHHDRIRSSRTDSADLAKQGEGQVGVQAPLVELVEDDGADAFEERVGEELAGEDALGRDAQPGPRADPPLEADLVADLLAQRPAVLLGDPPRRGAGRDAPGLEHDERRVRWGKFAVMDQGRRHTRRLARAGRRDQDEAAMPPGEGNDFREVRVDRQGQHGGINDTGERPVRQDDR